jgi:phage terminase large subunit-like protein
VSTSTLTALDRLAGLVMADGRRWAEVASDFQWRLARAFFDEDGPRFHFETRPRGGSKTTDGAALVTVALDELPHGARCYAAAADRDQAALLLDAIRGFVARTPALADVLDVSAWRVSSKRSGASLEVLAADSASAYGLLPHIVVVDELSVWPDTPNAAGMWEAISTGLGKVPGARALVIGTAGSPVSLAARVREHASKSELWSVAEVAGPLSWIDARFLADERARLPESTYARLHLNTWAESEDRLATLDDIRRCVTHSGPLPYAAGHRYVVTVDAGLVSDRTVALVAHAEHLHGPPGKPVARKVNIRRVPGMVPATMFDVVREQPTAPDPVTSTRVVLDSIRVWAGTRKRPVSLEAVEDWVAWAHREYGRAKVIVDPYQLAGTMQRLKSRGVRVEQFNFSPQSNARLASALHVALRNGTLALPDDPELVDELANVRMRETSAGTLRLDHASGKHDDRATALGLAVLSLVSRSIAGPVRRARVPWL